MTTEAERVELLLADAGIFLEAAELEELVHAYRTVRRQAELLWSVDTARYAEPAIALSLHRFTPRDGTGA